MKKWYSTILKEIRKLGDKVFIIDRYGLLKDPNLFKELRERFYMHEYVNDGSLFSFYNSYQDNSIIIYAEKPVLRGFINQHFRILEISPNEVFDQLDPEVMKQTDISYYQDIFDYYTELVTQGRIMDNTEDVLLKSIWGIDIGQLYSFTENLKIALSFIIDSKDIPSSIITKVSEKLAVDLRLLRNERKAFIEWIKNIINEYVNSRQVGKVPKYDLSDNLIQFYMLKLSITNNIDMLIKGDAVILKEKWLSRFSKSTDINLVVEKVKSMVSALQEQLKAMSSREFDLNHIDDLLKLSKLFCEVLYTIQINGPKMEDYFDLELVYDEFDKLLRMIVNQTDNKYESLFYFPHHKKPVTVDKIMDYITSNFKNVNIALIVFDGMSYDEWFILKEKLDGFEIDESEIFAIVPTITSFSRAAIFSGKTPDHFIKGNKKPNESREFYNCLKERGYNENDILFGHINLKLNMIKTEKEEISFGYTRNYRFIGAVCNLFDDLSHEDVQTLSLKSNLYKKIRNEIDSSSIVEYLRQLKNDGYKIIITSDHGNVFCKGNGIKPNRNLEFDIRESKRCLIFDRESFADEIVNKNPYNTFRYGYAFVPEGLIFVFSKGNECFINSKEYTIAHGGISPEELIVPLVVLS